MIHSHFYIINKCLCFFTKYANLDKREFSHFVDELSTSGVSSLKNKTFAILLFALAQLQKKKELISK